MTKARAARLASAMGMVVLVLALPARMTAAPEVPSAEAILQRVLATVARVPDVSADAEFRLRIRKSLSEPPDCVFRGTVQLVARHPTFRIGERTAGLVCWAVDRYVLGRRFQPRERLESFLSRFEYHVLGEKRVGNDRYYLVAAKARDPRTSPNAMIGWIDFERGLLVEGTVGYSWGSIDNEQGYTRIDNLWMLTHQYLYTARFSTSMEISYSNFHFAPH